MQSDHWHWVPCVCGTCGHVVPGVKTRLGNWSLRYHTRGGRVQPRFNKGARCLGSFRVTGHRPLKETAHAD